MYIYIYIYIYIPLSLKQSVYHSGKHSTIFRKNKKLCLFTSIYAVGMVLKLNTGYSCYLFRQYNDEGEDSR